MSGVIWWSAILLALLLAAFVLVAHLKKRLVKPDDTTGTGFTLADLRALHRGGKMSDEEFEKAKEAVVLAARRADERENAAKEEPGPPGDRSRM